MNWILTLKFYDYFSMQPALKETYIALPKIILRYLNFYKVKKRKKKKSKTIEYIKLKYLINMAIIYIFCYRSMTQDYYFTSGSP